MINAQKKPRILVVEDESVVARDISEQLVALGYEPVAQAQSGEEALLLTAQLRPDLVLMDIQLAGAMDGISAAQTLHKQWSVPVVFLTAFDADDTLERAKLAQPYGYLLKPFSERDLRTTLEVALYKCQAEARLQDMAQRTQAILNNMQDAVLSVDAQGDIESCNQAASRIFGYSTQQMLGANLSQLVPDQDWQRLQQSQSDAPPRAVDGVRQDGSTFPLVLTVSRLPQADGSSFMVLVHDLSSQHKDAQEIHRLAFYDRLTGLANRDWFKEHIGQAGAHSKRTGAHAALLLLDLDDFKKINDTYGLQTGDQLLTQAGQRMKSALRAADAVARLGGDEFAVLMQDLSIDSDQAAAQAQIKAQALIALLAQSYHVGAQACHTTASAGVVLFLGAQQDADDLLKKADIALYQAKNSGRNTVRFFDVAMQTRVVSHTQRLDDLGRGLMHNEFLLYYQPQVNRDGVMTGAEALVRWLHPTRGMVPPGEFIALAEESKLILPLGQWVLENACAQVRAWSNDPRTASCSVSINVSALQFAQANFVANVEFALRTTGANPKCIKLELTESMLVSDVPGVIAKMNQIRAFGVSFSLDDFGTGYSSLSYLKRLPLDQLKIDQSFVRDLLTDANDTAIAHAVIALGHSLGLQVIAEGVETAEQRSILADMNCDAFQGYLFSRPVPAAALQDYTNKSAT